MHLLIVQFAAEGSQDPRTCFSHHLGVMAAMLREAGHTPALLTLARFDPASLRRAIVSHRPRYIIVELRPQRVATARRTVAAVGEKYHLPVVAVGSCATAQPREALSIPGVEALLMGDYPQTAVDFFTVVAEGGEPAGLPGVWLNYADEVVRGEQPPLVEDPDSLPFPDRELFDYERIVARSGLLHIKACVGCGNWCGHCLNDWYLDLYESQGIGSRRRSPANVLDEIQTLRPRYPQAGAVRFMDHGLIADADWLDELAGLWGDRAQLPSEVHVTLGGLDQRRLDALRAMNCRAATVQILSGSRFIREEIFSLHLSDRAIIDGCNALADAGIAVTAEVFVGSPYESEITLEETLALLRECRLAGVRPSVYYPLAGTRAAELCAENGWISGRGESYHRSGRSVLEMPSMPAAMIDAVARRFDSLLKQRSTTELMKTLGRMRRGRKGLFRFHV